jgi:glycosyltransferase involved in cell wall biosynthesis
MKTLAVICIVKDEEKFIGRALGSVKDFANEIIVVDSGSTDDTLNIAKQFTDKIYTNDWLGYGPQKNFAISKTDCDFILQIDADEEVPRELKEEIKLILTQPNFNYYWLGIVTKFLGKPLKHLAGNNLRLFNRLTAQWDNKKVHEQIVRKEDGSPIKYNSVDSGKISSKLLHHGHYQTLTDYMKRQEKYTSADAEEMLATGKDRMGKEVIVQRKNIFSVWLFLFERATKQFVKKFFLRKGFMDGWRGWLWCFLSAQYEYKMCKKYLRLTRNNTERKN